MAGMMSSATPEWATPQDFFDKLNLIYGFDLDVCATPENAKCARFFTKEQDGLAQEWRGYVWMNPPYGNPEYPCRPNCVKKKCVRRGHHNHAYVPGIADWVKKAYDSAQAGATVACLLPARTDTRWWHDYCEKADYWFVPGRLKFGGGKDSAPFPSAVVVFEPSGLVTEQPTK